MMKKTRKTVKAMLSIFLTIVFIVQLLPAQVLSVDKTDETNTPSHDFAQTATDPVEIVELRDAYTKHFRSPEGQYFAEVHAQPVHYKQGGAWKDYDLSLQAKETEDGYFVRGTDTPVTFPQNFADGGKITVSHGTYSVGFGVSAANAGFNAKSSARTMSKTEDTSGASDELRYAKVLPNVDFTYTALPNGVKENVIVHKKQKSYRYTFDMDFGGLLPVKQEDGSIYLMVSANAKKPTFILDMPYMVDDAGQYSEAVTMTVQGTRLTLEADAEWMNASDRTFPVTIDPYCYVPTGSSSYIRSTYVTNLHPNQNYYGKISTGRNGLYSDRTYFQFAFPTLSEEYTFYRASLILHQNLGMHSGAQNYIDLYDLSAYNEWERSDITWNDQPVGSAFGAYAGTPRVDSCVLSTATDAVYTFNISSIAEAHYDDEEEDNGYLLAMRREDVGEFSWMTEVGSNSTPPEMRVYYTRPCIGCGDKCVYESVNGSSCPCTCASWEVCNCPECGEYCGCGKLNCTYGSGCECECPNEAVCNCVACKGYSRSNKDEVTGDVTSYVITDGTKTMTETYTYNTDHAVTGMTDANGNTVQYTYAAGSEQPSSITMGNSTVNYTYNSDDLLTAVSQNVTGLSSGTSIANGYTYNADKNVTSISHNDFAYNFVYNADGNNTQVKVGNDPLASYTYDANGNLTLITYGNGEQMRYTYDTENRLTAIFYETYSQYFGAFYFTYNSDGEIETIVDNCAGTETVFDGDGSGGYTVYDQATNAVLHDVHYSTYNDQTTVSTGGVWGYIDVTDQGSEFDFATGETTHTQDVETNACDMVSELVYDYFGRKTGSTTESENWIAENALTTHYVATAEVAKRELIEVGCDEKKITVIQNGSEPVRELSAAEKAAQRAALGIPNDAFVVGISARLEDYKGHKYLFEAATMTGKDDIYYLVVGDGSIADELHSLAEKLGIAKNVIFTGFVSDMAPYYGIMDVGANCSFGTETTPLAITEAMSVGVPSIVSDYGGNAATVTDGVDGKVIPMRDSKALADAVLSLYNDREKLAVLGENARRSHAEKYSAKKMTEKLEKLYLSLE